MYVYIDVPIPFCHPWDHGAYTVLVTLAGIFPNNLFFPPHTASKISCIYSWLKDKVMV